MHDTRVRMCLVAFETCAIRSLELMGSVDAVDVDARFPHACLHAVFFLQPVSRIKVGRCVKGLGPRGGVSCDDPNTDRGIRCDTCIECATEHQRTRGDVDRVKPTSNTHSPKGKGQRQRHRVGVCGQHEKKNVSVVEHTPYIPC